ncbi:RAM signaling network component [Myotisia sp. PD_48]|nr:RAM signaling network component [Myotisia sp. PD_48]
MSRTEDTIRPHQTKPGDASSDSSKAETRTQATSASHGQPLHEEAALRQIKAPPTRLLPEKSIIELARCAFESGLQDTKRSLGGGQEVDDVVRLKLTIDLGYANIGCIPDAVIDIIKDEVARLSLSNNYIDQIPSRFSECTHLRYLNIRANNFTEFPPAVYNLSFLEILDLSRNKIAIIPEDIRDLTSLRVFSIMQNRLEDLPSELADMSKLQVIKVSGNPLTNSLKSMLELREADIVAPDMTDNEKESALTAELKRFLKMRQVASSPEARISLDTTETISEPPKPPKRGNRFPVIPRPNNGTDSAPNSRSPSFSRPPPIPTRSHHRMASGQTNGIYRAGILTNGAASERNRSNSEGFIQGSAASRGKRMGLIRKNTDLGTLDEMRPYRNSHLRGLSHGSLLRPQHSGAQNGGSGSSSPSSPRDRRRFKNGTMHRLSSLPEHRTKTAIKNPVINAAKSVLYSLYQIHPHISSLIDVIKTEECRRSSLGIVFYNASTHLDQLNEALQHLDDVDFQDIDIARRATEMVKNECTTCITAYTHVGTQLRINASKIVSLCDPKYIRSLLLLIYGSLIELRNACAVFDTNEKKRPTTAKKLHAANEPSSKPPDREIEPSVTPTRDRHHPPPRRLRSETMVHQSNSALHAAVLPPFAPNPPGLPPFPAPLAPPQLSVETRSRSSSKSNTHLNPSGISSLANTPRSGESFAVLASPAMNKINPVTGLDELEEDRIFEKIFVQLSSASKTAHQAVPMAARQFAQSLELAEESRAPQHLQNLSRKLLLRCRNCLDVADALDIRLSNMKLKEPGGGMRNQKEFWQLCKTFIQSFVDLVVDIREAKNICLLPSEIVGTLRIVQKAIREAGRLIDTSPWSYLAELHTSNPTASAWQQNSHGLPYSHSTSSMAGTLSSFTNSTSPHSITMPATPLSAALGPAAQATVPSTPVSASSDRFFAGDVFQRADSLLSMTTTAPLFHRR